MDFEYLSASIKEQIYDTLIDLGLLTDRCADCGHARMSHWVDPYNHAVCKACVHGVHRWEPKRVRESSEQIAEMAQQTYLAWVRDPSPDNMDGPMAALSSALDRWDSLREEGIA